MVGKTEETEEKKERTTPAWIIKINSILNEREAKDASQSYKGNANGKGND